VYQRAAPGYALRVFMQVSNTLGIFVEIFDRTAYMLWKDGVLFRRETWKSAWRFLFGSGSGSGSGSRSGGGSSVEPNTGFLRGLGRDYWRWYRRDFHPEAVDDGPLLEAWRPRIEAEIASA
jgi:predicted metal-dependent hydrolase